MQVIGITYLKMHIKMITQVPISDTQIFCNITNKIPLDPVRRKSDGKICDKGALCIDLKKTGIQQTEWSKEYNESELDKKIVKCIIKSDPEKLKIQCGYISNIFSDSATNDSILKKLKKIKKITAVDVMYENIYDISCDVLQNINKWLSIVNTVIDKLENIVCVDENGETIFHSALNAIVFTSENNAGLSNENATNLCIKLMDIAKKKNFNMEQTNNKGNTIIDIVLKSEHINLDLIKYFTEPALIYISPNIFTNIFANKKLTNEIFKYMFSKLNEQFNLFLRKNCLLQLFQNPSFSDKMLKIISNNKKFNEWFSYATDIESQSAIYPICELVKSNSISPNNIMKVIDSLDFKQHHFTHIHSIIQQFQNSNIKSDIFIHFLNKLVKENIILNNYSIINTKKITYTCCCSGYTISI